MLRITYPGLELSTIRKGVDAASTAALAAASGSSLGERVRNKNRARLLVQYFTLPPYPSHSRRL
jgi:hypothetical protein